MKINKLSARHVIFTHVMDEWDLHLHLIIGENRNYLIDTGLGSESVAFIDAYIKANNVEQELIIINTHYHWDHIWGNHFYPDATIISHKLCYEQIVAKWDEMYEQYGVDFQKGTVLKSLPNLTFTESLAFEDDHITLFFTPGHTIDGISVYDAQEGILNIGDNIGDDMEELLPNLEVSTDIFVQTLQNYVAIPGLQHCVSGHNVVVPPSILQQMLRMLEK